MPFHEEAISKAKAVLADPSAKKSDIQLILRSLLRSAEYYKGLADEAAPLMTTIKAIAKQIVEDDYHCRRDD